MDRCAGALLAVACGDILGAPVEFRTRSQIREHFGELRDFVGSPDRPRGTYTDDTEMTLALATSLIEKRGVDPAHCAATYAAFYQSVPRRGYGPSARRSLDALLHGEDWRKTATLVHPAGSYANGAPMRIAPIGLAYRNASDRRLREAVADALACTHVHPDAVDAAFVQAGAVALLALLPSRETFDPLAMLDDLHSRAGGATMRQRLSDLHALLVTKAGEAQVLRTLCVSNDEFGRHFAIHACDAVALALWALCVSPLGPEQCIVRAVNLGGDTDTQGALAGALAGALHGARWIPSRWFEQIENDAFGRDAIVQLARLLAALDLQ